MNIIEEMQSSGKVVKRLEEMLMAMDESHMSSFLMIRTDIAEILELLKTRTATLLTKEDVTDRKWRDEPLFLETQDGSYYEWAIWYKDPEDGCMSFEWAHSDSESWRCILPLEEYGITWRCWTRRPTEDEAEEVEWE